MTTVVTRERAGDGVSAAVSARANGLAERLEKGALALENLARALTDAEWAMPLPHDGRTLGVIVHHVASMYPIEIQLAQTLAAGDPIVGVTWGAVAEINAGHARENASVTREAAIEALRTNSAEAAAAIRGLSDDELDRAATVSLNGDAPLTCQFFVEDHALRHSYHHAAKIRAFLKR
jgi:hypothetical protein